MVGYSSGGNDIVGPMVWAGIREFKNVSSDFGQIVGILRNGTPTMVAVESH